MKVRVTLELQEMPIPGTQLKGKVLVAPEDNVNYEMYEMYLSVGDTIQLVPAHSKEYNHIYYCIHGDQDVTVSMGESFQMTGGSTLALTGDMSATATAKSKSRLLVIYVKRAAEGQTPTTPLFSKLNDVIGTERDVDFTTGHSRRYLKKSDGFNISVHNTWIYKSQVTPLKYKRHIEACYYIQGEGKYSWDQGTEEQAYDYDDLEAGDGAMFLMDQHDAHKIHTGETDNINISVFYPALEGTETHDFSQGGYSGY